MSTEPIGAIKSTERAKGFQNVLNTNNTFKRNNVQDKLLFGFGFKGNAVDSHTSCSTNVSQNSGI